MSHSSHSLPSFVTPVSSANPCTPPLASYHSLSATSLQFASPITPSTSSLKSSATNTTSSDAALHLLCLAAENSPQSSTTNLLSHPQTHPHSSSLSSSSSLQAAAAAAAFMYHPNSASHLSPSVFTPSNTPPHLDSAQDTALLTPVAHTPPDTSPVASTAPAVSPQQQPPPPPPIPPPPPPSSALIAASLANAGSPQDAPLSTSPHIPFTLHTQQPLVPQQSAQSQQQQQQQPQTPPHMFPLSHLPPHYPLYAAQNGAFGAATLFSPTQPFFAYPPLPYSSAAPALFGALPYAGAPPSAATMPSSSAASVVPPNTAVSQGGIGPDSTPSMAPAHLNAYPPPGAPLSVGPPPPHALYAPPPPHGIPTSSTSGIAGASPSPMSMAIPVPMPSTSPTTPVLVRKVKGPWRPEEDAILTQLVAKFGPRRWTVIASHIPGRTGKQARERWLNQLSPDLAKRPWTPEEDRIVMEAHARLGNRWSEIAKLLKGRTDNATKNRFNTTIRRQISEMAANSREFSEAVAPIKRQMNVDVGEGINVPAETPATGDEDEPGSLITSSYDGSASRVGDFGLALAGVRNGKRKRQTNTNDGELRQVSQRAKTMTASS